MQGRGQKRTGENSRPLYVLTQRQNLLAELFVDDLANSAVNRRQTAEDALKTGNHGDGLIVHEITDGQQEEQNGQAAEHHLGSTVVLQGADEHETGEDAPQQQVVAHGFLAGGLDAGITIGIDPDEHQAPPEQTVSGESGAGKGVALLQLADTGDDLRQTAQSDTHSNDDDGQRQQTGIMQVQDFMSGMKSLVGGELNSYTEMLNEARQVATKRMVDEATVMGADAVINIRYESASLMQGAAEVMVYGTAVKYI